MAAAASSSRTSPNDDRSSLPLATMRTGALPPRPLPDAAVFSALPLSIASDAMDARTLPTSSDLRGWASALVSSSTKAAKCLDDECFWMRRSDSEVDRAVKSSLLRHSMSSGLSARRGRRSVSSAGEMSTKE